MANYVLDCTGDELDKAVLFIKQSVAPAFSTSNTYYLGDTVVHDGLLYACIVTMLSPGTWDSTKWNTVKIFDNDGYLILNSGNSTT